MSNQRFANPGALFLGAFFCVPFLIYSFGAAQTSYLIAALLLVAFLALLFMNFEVGFLTLIFIRSSLDYMKNFGGEGRALNLAAVVSLALIVLGIFYVLFLRINILKLSDAKPFLLFIAICGLSISYSINPLMSFSDWLRLLSVFSVYLLTRLIFTSESKIKIALTAILLSSLLPILLGYYQLITGNGVIYDGGQKRLVGAFLHPNAFASYLIIILIFCTSQLLEGAHFINKRLMQITAFLTGVIFIFTLSRGAWIVFALALVLMGILRYRKLLGLLPFFLVLMLAVPAVRHRITNMAEPNQYARGRSAWDWRVDTWEEIGNMVAEKPILGHGLSTVEEEFHLLTHNDYLRLLAEVGGVGFVIYLILALCLWRNTWRDFIQSHSPVIKSFQVGTLAMIAAFFVREFADNTLRNTVVMIYFWIFIALVRNISLLESDEFHDIADQKIMIEPYAEA